MLSTVHQRVVVLLLAAAFLMLSFDVAVGHFADQALEHWAQVPGTTAPLVCALLLLLAAVFSLKSLRWFRRLTRAAGALSILTGAAGAWFHAARFLADLGDEFSWEAILETLSVTPPLLAPLSFVAIGALLGAIHPTKSSSACCPPSPMQQRLTRRRKAGLRHTASLGQRVRIAGS